MTDTATTRKRLRKQSLGSNTNTWGDTKLNEVLDAVDQSMDGYLAIALTGDLTLTTTNYTTADQAKRRVHKFTGSLSSAAAVTYPSVEGWYFQINSAGQTVTVKCSGGTGIAIPNGRSVLTYCDGTDFYSMVPNYLPTATTLTNNQDLVSSLQLSTAIANATIPAAAGTVLVSVADTTAGYVGTKVNVTGSGAASVVASITNPGANEVKTFAVSVGALGLSAQSEQTSGFAPVAGSIYPVNIAVSGTITFPASASNGDTIGITNYGAGVVTFNWNGLKYNGSTTSLATNSKGLAIFRYGDATNGWTDA